MTDDGWEDLLAGLRELGAVEEVAPGRTVVRYAGRTVTIVMTPDDWDAWCGPVLGGVRYGVEIVLGELRRWSDAPYAVFGTYELRPSERPELPRDPAELRIEQWMRQHPGEIAGEWHASPPSGD